MVLGVASVPSPAVAGVIRTGCDGGTTGRGAVGAVRTLGRGTIGCVTLTITRGSAGGRGAGVECTHTLTKSPPINTRIIA